MNPWIYLMERKMGQQEKEKSIPLPPPGSIAEALMRKPSLLQVRVDRLEEDVKEFRQSQPATRSASLVLFPFSQDLCWEEVTITLMTHESIKIKAKDISRRYTFAELGFKDKRRGDLPNKKWKLLMHLCEHGEISYQTFHANPPSKMTVSRLRKKLRDIMKIEDDPFHPYQNGAWHPKFTAKDKCFGGS